MYDAGIDWLGRVQREELAGLAVAPFLEEAGGLLYAASYAWPGRVRAKQLRETAQDLYGKGWELRRQAMGWADHEHGPDDVPFPHNQTFPPDGPRVGAILARMMDMRRYHPICERKDTARDAVPKAPAGAMALCSAGASMLQEAIGTFQLLEQRVGSGDQRFRDRRYAVEDILEILLEHPCAVQGLSSLNVRSAVHDRALLRTVDTLMGARRIVSATQKERDRVPSYAMHAHTLYGTISDDATVAALEDCSDGVAYLDADEQRWLGTDEKARCAAIIDQIAQGMLHAVRAPPRALPAITTR